MDSSNRSDADLLRGDESELTETQIHGTIMGRDGDLDRTVIRARVPQGDSAPAQAPRGSFRLAWHGAAEALIGQQLDHFRIESLVGIGGMGAVFRGEDIRLNREVAIKAIPAAGRDPEAMRRFRFEAQSAAKLDHPNIARVYYVGETAEWSYIVFEFVEGINLREWVLRHGPMSVDQSVFLVRQVAQALQHASDRQVVHRDIKPSNIVLTANGHAKIVDMGLARVTEMDRSTNDLTASGVTLGTFDYISPEQAHDPRDADVRSDIYSLGCTWYFLLTSSPPFPEGTALQKLLMHGTKMPEDPRAHRPELSDSLIAILRKMIAKRPGDRYQQPIDLIDDLQTLAILENLQWTRDTDPRELVSEASGSWARWMLPHAVALACIAGVMFWMQAEGLRNGQFEIPRVVLPELQLIDRDTNTAAKGVESSTPVLSVPAESGSIVVDNRFSLEQLETNRQLASTMDQALERINLTPDATKIVLQSTSLRSLSNLRGFGRTQGKLTITSPPGQRCTIEVDVPSTELTDSRAWLDCGNSQVRIVGCDFVWRAKDARQALFQCRSGGQLVLEDCSIAIDANATMSGLSTLPAAIRCEASLIPTSLGDSSGLMAPAQIHVRNVILSGFGDALQVVAPVRAECKWENSLFALSGSVLQLPRVNATTRGASRIVMDLQNVTTWTARSWIYASWVTGNTTPIPVTRTARQCVFGGMESIVVWDVAASEDWKFWTESNQGEDLSRWLDFRGVDNCYDEEVTKQLVEARLRNGMSEQLPLTAESKLLAEERGLELSIPWQKRPVEEAAIQPLSDVLQFELFESNFPRGADMKRLQLLRTAVATPSLSSATVDAPNGVPSRTTSPADL
ncbi:serine/threonine-protein kinase [Pirellulaceae bacterium SH467]